MFSKQITFVLFMFNEEARIERAVRNFLPYGHVLIVDNHSTDRTVEIARALGAEVLLHKNPGWVEDEHTTSLVKAAVRTTWMYWGFSDEIVDRHTMDAMLAAVEGGKCSIVNIARKNYYYGEFCHDAYRNTQHRAFKKDAIDFRGNVIHGFGKATVPESDIVRLDPDACFVHHFISNTAKSYMGSLDRYTDIEAMHAEPMSPLKMLLRMVRGFLGHYVVKGGRKAGRAGVYLGLQTSMYTLMLCMKAYERVNDLTTRTIEARNDRIRDQLLLDLERGAPSSSSRKP
jgi:glycosyltransferase involved in cell wall biosynthesis